MRRQEKKDDSPLVLGIDPGSHYCGYGLLLAGPEGGSYVASGRLVMKASLPLHERLRELHEGLSGIIAEFSPTDAVVEKVFFSKSVRGALGLGHARGVVLLSAAEAGLSLHEYTALAAKKAVTGYGRAEKSQVQSAMKSLLGIKSALSTDSADALALALCHINRLSYAKAVTAQ